MPVFDISFMRVDRDEGPTLVESFFRTVDWPALPREGEGLELGADLDPVAVESSATASTVTPMSSSAASSSTISRPLSCASSAGG